VQGDGQSIGVPAAGEHENVFYNPTGSPGIHHWQQAAIARSGINERGSVFFAAIEMTRMPTILTDPNLPDNPIVFANRAFQDLTGYTEEEVLGRHRSGKTARKRLTLNRRIEKSPPFSPSSVEHKRWQKRDDLWEDRNEQQCQHEK